MFWEGTEGQKGLATFDCRKSLSRRNCREHESIQRHPNEAEDFLSVGMSGLLAVINSMVIILREGFEAALILGAIRISALRTARANLARASIGTAAAIALSVFIWWAAQSLITITVAWREIIEGVASLVAVAVLFYAHQLGCLKKRTLQIGSPSSRSRWARRSTQVPRWRWWACGHRRLPRRIGTVLFYQALLFDAGASSVWLGFI
ncbi:MAG: FTR1 family protein, partial [Anaerolineales bacterium]|nr:FTR1 family protein [Anaerolineales bacterium]